MPSKAILISRKLSNLVEKDLKKIRCPLLMIHTEKEGLGDYKKVREIAARTRSELKEILILRGENNHNYYYSENRELIKDKIITFVKKNNLFGKTKRIEKVTAIVPAFNEEKRITKVLQTLKKSKLINQIIVINDGSTDNTRKVVRKIKGIEYYENKENKGKGYSMDLGVKKSKNNIIFFCDADLKDFKEIHIKEIITPVLKGEYDMFIGTRSNFMQKTVKAWSLNSGERALRKEVWFNLPDFYKHRYRIEAGLNYYVKHYKNGFGYKKLNYSQPTKESKYGLIKGTFLRWWMNLDVVTSYFSYSFISYLQNK